MTLNLKTRRGSRYLAKHGPMRVFLDGVEVKQCWYVDRRRQVVKTYDSRGDGIMRYDPQADAPETKTLYGKRIEIRPL